MMQEKNTLTVLKLITEDITFKNKKIMENTQELVNSIKEQIVLIESEIDKPTLLEPISTPISLDLLFICFFNSLMFIIL